MNELERPLVDILAVSSRKRQTVEQRIERRLTVLRLWLEGGVPAGKSIPKSLTSARVWHDLELDILPISSPNEFTTTHHMHGRDVQKLSDLIAALKRRYGRPKRSASGSPALAASSAEKRLWPQLEAAVSQWHAERDRRLSEQKAAAAAEARNILNLQEKDRLIAELRRQLAVKTGFRVIE